MAWSCPEAHSLIFLCPPLRKIPWINIYAEVNQEKEQEMIGSVGQGDSTPKITLSEFSTSKELMEKELDARVKRKWWCNDVWDRSKRRPADVTVKDIRLKKTLRPDLKGDGFKLTIWHEINLVLSFQLIKQTHVNMRPPHSAGPQKSWTYYSPFWPPTSDLHCSWQKAVQVIWQVQSLDLLGSEIVDKTDGLLRFCSLEEPDGSDLPVDIRSSCRELKC